MKKLIPSILIIASAGLNVSTRADLVIFENDNPAYAMRIGGWLSVPAEYQSLDIAVDAWNQPGPSESGDILSDSTFLLSAPWFYEFPHTFYISLSGKWQVGDVALDEGVVLFDDENGFNATFWPPHVVADGAVIDDTLTFGPRSAHFLMSNDTNGFIFFVPEEPTFIVAVRVLETDGFHYGFIEFEHPVTTDITYTTFQPIRWGYETDPDTAVVVPGCIADLTMDGVLDFFDVSAFILAYANNDPVADFVDDGVFNFFDVSAFLAAFSAGCP